MIQKIRNYLENRKLHKKTVVQLVATIQDLNNRLQAQIDKAVELMEEFDQDKIYYCYIDPEQFDYGIVKNMMQKQIKLLKNHMKWTMPNMFFTAVPIEEITEDKLKDLLKTMQRGKKR